LMLTDFTPRLCFDCRLWFPRLCQLVTRAPDPLAELGSRSGNAFISTLGFKL
jgi:hypothetical protein